MSEQKFFSFHVTNPTEEKMKYGKDNMTLIEQFITEVHFRAKEIDPDNEYDWRDLTYGWALGKGIEPEAAAEFALFIRYSTDLG